MSVQRILWLGMHKVLRTTELPQLRDMGYEVFSPAYISPHYDQSADRTIDLDQPTTLPADVFDMLIRHDFFYTQVPGRIAELLNSYFDAVIVTISSEWLESILDAYRGPVIYRIYGQHFSLAEKMRTTGLWDKVMLRDNLTIVPFCEESIADEFTWFRDLCTHIVPYQIPDDVFDHSGLWARVERQRQVATHIPNVENPYFQAAYADFDASYPHRIFRIYGPQRSHPADPRIVGALDRREFLENLARSSGFLYNYKDAVCYLTPIEMMELGGPVLYAPGSLLSRLYGEKTPGLLQSPQAAEKKLRYLMSGDLAFIADVVAAQETVRQRYDRAIVRPKFEQAFARLLGNPLRAAPIKREGRIVVANRPAPEDGVATGGTTAILLHVDGLFGYSRGRAFAFEGIPRVVDAIVQSLVERSDARFLITCTQGSRSVLYDFFRDYVVGGRVTLYAVDDPDVESGDIAHHLSRLDLIEYLNERPDISLLIVPHYYLFPESLLFKRAVSLYLPDYFPYLMPDAVFDVSAEKDRENKAVGVAIARKAKAVFTSSQYTKDYLVQAGFVEAAELDKVAIVPLPLLGMRQTTPIAAADEAALIDRIAGRRFLFYPTANRPNKNLAFFLKLLARLRESHPDLTAVMTTPPGLLPDVQKAMDAYGLQPHVEIMTRIGDDEMAWLYRNAAALCLTSSLEGNFPPQVLEALSHGTPVVATRLPPIVEALGDHAEKLLLCRAKDADAFLAGLQTALSDRAAVLRRQAEVLSFLQTTMAPEVFFERLQEMLAIARKNETEGSGSCASA